MLGEDGRVRVMDFGLAAGAIELAEDQAEAPTLDSSDRPIKLTRTGALIGTPAYMSPEQLNGEAVDARSDQFGFAVALYEALHGCRPFKGKTVRELRAAIVSGALARTPRSTAVPSWLDRLLARALSVRPEDRFPSMTALIDALDDDPIARRRWRVGVAVALAIPGALWLTAATLGVRAATRGPCRGLEAGLVDVWDSTRAASARAAFAATELGHADATWARVEGSLDAYARAWVSARVAACEASRDGLQSDALLDRKITCLDEHLDVLGALVDELDRADEDLVARAIQAARALPRIELCADADALMAAVAPPADPARAAEAEQLGGQLGVIEARYHLGRFAEASAQLDAISSAIDSLGYRPLEIRAGLWRAHLQHAEGGFEDAARTYKAVYYDALGQRMFELATKAAAELVTLLIRTDDVEAAAPWIEAAAATAEAARSDSAQAVHVKARGELALLRGRHDEARRAFEEALALMERLEGAEALSTNTCRVALASVAHAEGRVAEADALLERAMTTFEEILGPDSPMLSTAINDMGAAAYLRGDYRQARELFERSLAIDTRTLGADHPDLATGLSNLGALAKLEGDLEAARAYLERALELLERVAGPDNVELAPILINLGTTEMVSESYDDARARYLQALRLRERVMGPEHPEVAEALHYLGTVAKAEGDFDAAAREFSRARAIFESSSSLESARALSLRDSWIELLIGQGRFAEAEAEAEAVLDARERTQGHGHPGCQNTLLNLGRARLGGGRVEEALAPLERSFMGFDGDVSAPRRAAAQLALAQALWDAPADEGRDRERALQLATSARDALASDAPAEATQLRAVEDWLKTRAP